MLSIFKNYYIPFKMLFIYKITFFIRQKTIGFAENVKYVFCIKYILRTYKNKILVFSIIIIRLSQVYSFLNTFTIKII